MTTDPQLIHKVAALTEVASDMTRAVDELAIRDHRRRIQLVVLAVSVLLDICLSVGFFVALHRTNEAQTKLERLGNAARVTCLANNDAALKQHALWDGLIASSKGDPAQAAAFKKTLDTTFAQKKC